jgi:hypothetical protein
MWNELPIKLYTRSWIRAKFFCVMIERSFFKKVTLFYVYTKIEMSYLHKTTRLVKIGGQKSWKTFASFAKSYRKKFNKLANSSTG